MDEHRLHSVKWYRDMNEIFRYNPSQKPPIRLFNVSGIMVQSGECAAEWCAVRVMPPPVATRAAYTCEISTEGPKFLIARQTKYMTVSAMGDRAPVISGAPPLVRPGDQLMLNCSSDYSLPPSNINWYIDGELQKPEPWEQAVVSSPREGGLRASWRVLRVTAPARGSGALRVTCEAELPLEPPLLRDSSVLITVHSHTHPDKYVANRGQSSVLSLHLLKLSLIWTFMEIYRYMSL
ncbi:unnamed protein product [Plutella xylostella]|nr:unnamed protein product [Plutella xylostella]